MSEIPLNKFEKEKRVVELHLEGETIRDISKEVHMSFGPISKIIKAYEKKVRLQHSNKKEHNLSSLIKNPSISSQAFKLFREGKELTDVAIDLEIPAKKAVELWPLYISFYTNFIGSQILNPFKIFKIIRLIV